MNLIPVSFRDALCGLALLVVLAPATHAKDAVPKAPRLDEARLKGLDTMVEGLIAKKRIPGAVIYVAHRGAVAYFKAFGKRDLGAGLPMERDTVFRIYSMSKPITAVAALIAVEQGKLDIDDPVTKYVPEFESLAPAKGKLERKMTVKDLLCHTAGFSYGFGFGPIDQLYRTHRILDTKTTLDLMASKLAKLPLVFSPGERWHYGVSSDVLGLVVQRATKTPFDAFLQKQLLLPLGMNDTGFTVSKSGRERFAANYRAGLIEVDSATKSNFLRAATLHSGGGGLVSTASDYARFARMLSGGGKLGDVRILKAETVAQMTTNRLGAALVPITFATFTMPGTGFGYGVSVRVSSDDPSEVGEYGWAGMASTTFTTFPKDDVTVITMTQITPIDMTLGIATRTIVLEALKNVAAPKGR